ncbi:MAG: fumarylacetoacetate hydrolase family protein [Deltaproteobacteria bacterium]|nr:fumarylacetoacetate hydrolase family protein [Deltaproteobacteria bacterium]
MPRLLEFTTMFRYVRFQTEEGLPQYGIIKPFHFSVGTGEEQIMVLDGTPFDHDLGNPETTEETVARDQVKLLTPVLPSKIIGIAYNYRDKAAEQGKPIPEVPFTFVKALNALRASGESIRLNRHCTEVHFEAELAVVVGKSCRNVTEAQALDYVGGYTIGNDITDRVIQKKEPTFARAKGMDTFCPLGPFLVRGVSWEKKNIRTWVNGQLRQSGNTSDMIHGVPKIISFVSEFMTLNPGDVILTGSPAGTSALKAGDRIKIEIDELGSIENVVEYDV